VIFALQNPAVSEELLDLINSEFVEEGSLERALELIKLGGGIEAARQLARQEADAALSSLDSLDDCTAKRSLQLMVEYVLQRIY
jgi:all-trans-nonaprenyl-diphosphate synthase